MACNMNTLRALWPSSKLSNLFLSPFLMTLCKFYQLIVHAIDTFLDLLSSSSCDRSLELHGFILIPGHITLLFDEMLNICNVHFDEFQNGCVNCLIGIWQCLFFLFSHFCFYFSFMLLVLCLCYDFVIC